MKSIPVFLFAFLILPVILQGQDRDFPVKLKPGEQFVGRSVEDTLFYVMKDRQLRVALAKDDSLQLWKQKLELLDLKSTKLQQVVAMKDSTITDYRTGYDRYRIKWEGVHEELEEAEVQILKLRRWTLFSGVLGVGAGVLLGALVF